MDFALSPEQEMIVATVRGFVERELQPLEAEVERTGAVRPEVAAAIRDKVKAIGFYAPNVPVEYGGGGLDTLSLTLLERELGRASMALTHHWHRPSNILCAGTPEQIGRFLLPSVRGERMDCLAISEPEAGSDVKAMRTRARRDGDDWILSGAKHFISHADVADFAIVFAVTGEAETARGRSPLLTCFLVEKGVPGFEVRPGYRSVSHRGYNNAVLVFDDVRLSAAEVLGEPDRGLDLMTAWLSATRLTVAAMAVGRARRVLAMAVEQARARRQFGRPIGDFQGTGFKLADMATGIDAADLLTLAAADRVDRGLPAGRAIAEAKLFATETLGRVTDDAVQIFGGMGLMDDLPIERFWRDARVERIWDGTSEIQRHIISRALLRGED